MQITNTLFGRIIKTSFNKNVFSLNGTELLPAWQQMPSRIRCKNAVS